ncbi:MAG: type VI secretion system tip protein VgrG, partial [Sedimentisphaerales bacterium]|nr:type VI secretion system tip protein VgrG [Sedimentisphaerales bacterium]
KLTQAGRVAGIATPLGEDELVLQSLHGEEQLGRPFRYELELLSENTQINLTDLVGQNVTVWLQLSKEDTRYFNGFVSRAYQTDAGGSMARYRATVVPWLWFLTRTSDCRIFQEMSVPDIIKEVFRGHGFTDFDEQLSGEYREWEYCAQYRETDFNFVSRLMEQEGIYYFFKHEDGKHTLVLADAISTHEAYPKYEEIKYRAHGKGHSQGQYIQDWTFEMSVQPGSCALCDYDFKNPKNELRVISSVERDHAAAQFEIFDYPGEYTESADGEAYARIRIEELQTQHTVVRANSDARGVCTGCTFTLTDFPREDQNQEYLITSVNFQINSDVLRPGEQGESSPVFSCTFNAMDAGQPFRPSRITPRPTIAGPQVAVVVGPSGEEIHTDEYGRVKVQFPWDRQGIKDENSSCWIRVSQSWAGKNWGAMIIPRITQEVIVEFLEGDPDRPIITGRVYNADNMPPYDLPDNKTMSTMKSNSSKGGQGFNEIRFEDKTDEEQIFVHAQKNQDVRVQNDSFEWIGNNRHLVVKKDQIEHVENNRNEKVDADHKEEIGKDRNLKVKGKEAKAVDGSLSLTVGDDVIEVFKKNHSEETTKDYYLKADNIVIEGMTNVTVKVGDSFIAIESGGIKIGTSGDIVLEASGNIEQTAMGDVSLEATGNASVKGTGGLALESTAKAELKAPKTAVKGDAMLELTGGLVKIN